MVIINYAESYSIDKDKIHQSQPMKIMLIVENIFTYSHCQLWL
ncbi:MAG: hypothetical protein QNJ63_12430 [Calothrix sp. MO_192.B10]|nr:hypothetical protein [Calothrix sp. MO_192.B10]